MADEASFRPSEQLSSPGRIPLLVSSRLEMPRQQPEVVKLTERKHKYFPTSVSVARVVDGTGWGLAFYAPFVIEFREA